MPGKKEAITETSLVLPEISCAHCRAGLEENLSRLPGVKGVEVSLRRKRVRIRFDPLQTSEEMIEKSLAGLGYSIQL
ncbi:MAG: heavy-metal-associated domain-containing protein [Firmicutes bacterium]|nr:heavy-metal-associated domain-containing protein [Bacillota bacterium]